jgi:DnaJ-class molecular chaperone
MAKDYYATLGIKKEASKEEIKKSFHKMAHKYHPDKNKGDDTKFKEVNEAYQTLSDDTKRSQYDRFGSDGPQGFGGGQQGGGFSGFGNGFGGFDFSGAQGGVEFDMGDLGDIFGEFFGGGRRQRVKRGRNIEATLDLNFEDAIFGVERTVHLGKQATQESVTVNIPAGINANEMVKVTGMGEKVSDGQPGDLYIRVKISPHSLFRREALNLIIDIEIKLTESILGVKYNLKTLENKNIEVKIPEGTHHGDLLRVRGYGVPSSRGRGDIILRILVKTPTKLSKKSKELVEKLKEEVL